MKLEDEKTYQRTIGVDVASQKLDLNDSWGKRHIRSDKPVMQASECQLTVCLGMAITTCLGSYVSPRPGCFDGLGYRVDFSLLALLL